MSILSNVEAEVDSFVPYHQAGDVSLVTDLKELIDKKIADSQYVIEEHRHRFMSGIVSRHEFRHCRKYLVVLNAIKIKNVRAVQDNDFIYFQQEKWDYGSYTLKHLMRLSGCDTRYDEETGITTVYINDQFIWFSNTREILFNCLSYSDITFEFLKIPFEVKDLPREKLTIMRNPSPGAKRRIYKTLIPRITQTFVYSFSANTTYELLENFGIFHGIFLVSPYLDSLNFTVDIKVYDYERRFTKEEMIRTKWKDTYYVPFTEDTEYDDIRMYYKKGIIFNSTTKKCTMRVNTEDNCPLLLDTYTFKPTDYQIHNMCDMTSYIRACVYYVNDEYKPYTNTFRLRRADSIE